MKKFWVESTSALWSTGTALARFGIQNGILKPTRLPSRVISVGNIQAGGAGKTPLVAQIAKEAQERNLKTCILTRGYKGQWESTGGILFPKSPHVASSVCGDEAALLHELCPFAYLGIGADRIQQYEKIREKFNLSFDLVILDDGFQNWKIQKDLEIVALTSAKRSEVLFRDWEDALEKADLIVWTKGEIRPPHAGKPMVRVKYHLPQAVDKGAQYWLVTGIADGNSAVSLARESGYSISRHLSFSDHENYQEVQIRAILKDASAANCKTAMTGKDWVKWRDLGVHRSEVLVLEPELRFEEGREVWLRRVWGE